MHRFEDRRMLADVGTRRHAKSPDQTGDLVKAASQPVCACGTSDLALEGGILSRIDDMVVVRGVNVYPSAIHEIIRGIGAITEYRVTVDSSRTLPELKIDIEVDDPASALATREELEKSIHRAFALRVPFTQEFMSMVRRRLRI